MSNKEALEKELQSEVEYLLAAAREFAVFASTVDDETGIGTDAYGFKTHVLYKMRGFRHRYWKYDERRKRIEEELEEQLEEEPTQPQPQPQPKNYWRIAGELTVCAFVGVAMAFILLGWAYGCGEHYVDAKGDTHVHECPL